MKPCPLCDCTERATTVFGAEVCLGCDQNPERPYLAPRDAEISKPACYYPTNLPTHIFIGLDHPDPDRFYAIIVDLYQLSRLGFAPLTKQTRFS